MDEAQTLELICGLSRPENRRAAADALARHLGAEALVLLVKDRQLGAFLPAVGMSQTLPGGKAWSELLRRANEPGEHRLAVAFPDRQSSREALALATADGLVLVLIGGAPSLGDTRWLCLPLLAATLRAELDVAGALGRERSAREEARHVATLVAVLDATRAELERALEETRRLNGELLGAAGAKDEFLAMLAHELRNPLSPIVSALNLLRLQGPAAPSFPWLLEVMGRQVRQLSRLVDDLLDVSRISRGLILLRREPVTVQSALSEAVESVRPLIEAEHHELAISAPDEPLYVYADAVRLTQIFANLMTNAAKYTNPGGHIAVSAQREGPQVVVRVRDTGIGIEKEMLPRIFDVFTQAPRALDRAQGGLGLGLTLVRRLVALHGGSIEVRSEGIGKGSEFEVRLPLTDQPAPAQIPVNPAPRANRLRVLIVDDNVDAAELLAEALSLAGHEVAVAHDGPEALQVQARFRPDVGVLDIGLPVMDGYKLATRMRQVSAVPMRLIALTGYGQSEDRERSARAGFDAHLVKPVEIEEIAGLVSRMPIAPG